MSGGILLGFKTEKAKILCLPTVTAVSDNVVEISSEAELREKLETGVFSAVVLEDALPWGNAFSTVAGLRATDAGSRVPIVVFSIHAASRQRALSAGASGFLHLPFDEGALKRALGGSEEKTILFVDDSSLIHKMVDAVFSGEQYRILHAENGVEALSILRTELIDIVVTDIEMPGMDGYELCHTMKTSTDTAEIPVIIQSSLSSGAAIDKAFDAGADDYVTKPIVADELVSRVRAFFGTEESRHRELILVVDDSTMIQGLICRALARHGFATISASNGQEALDLAADKPVGLAIVDQEMPLMKGSEFVRAFRAVRENASVPIVMLSGRDTRTDRARRRSVGVADFIAKPFSVDRLLATIERVLAEARYQRERDAMKMYVSDAVRTHASAVAESGARELTMRADERFTTILFADIVGFTPMCENLSPEKVVDLLNAIFDIVVRILTSNGAVIDKFIGDAIMALFGGGESGAYLAVKAGLEIIDALRDFNAKGGREVHLRIGINSGTVIMGDIGSQFFRRDYTVVGDAVNVAQRLESVAPPDTVLISEATEQLLNKQFGTKELDPISVKGKEIPVRPYEVTGLSG